MSKNDSNQDELDVLIIGAGFSGLYLLHKLRGEGYKVHTVEAGPEVGGTWFWNRYPGARCDVESVDYSYSWDPEMDQTYEWTEKYPAQADILKYLKAVAEKHDLRKDIEFNTRVTAMSWDEETKRWTSTTDTGKSYTAQYVMMAVGCLSVPKEPSDLPNFDRFKGEVLRTWNWPEDADLTGKKVAVIGTGSTGAQVIPALAEIVGSLLVIQRTPNFVIPTRNRPLKDGELEEIRADYPDRRRRNRAHAAGVFRSDNPKNAMEVDAQERHDTFQERWEGGGINFLGAFADLMFNKEANDAVCEFVHEKIDETVTDKAVADLLKPRSYPMGAKRPVIATDYYETFNKPNVTLADVRTNALATFTETGVEFVDGSTFDFDVLVLATGFDSFTGAFTQIDITGRDGRKLADEWTHQGPATYLGLSTAGFPNMVLVANVGSPSVLANMITAIEQHVEWVSHMLADQKANGRTTIEAEPTAQKQWVDTVEAIANMTLWPQGDSGSWYRGANIPGKPQLFMPYAGGIAEYEKAIDAARESDYEGFVTA